MQVALSNRILKATNAKVTEAKAIEAAQPRRYLRKRRCLPSNSITCAL